MRRKVPGFWALLSTDYTLMLGLLLPLVSGAMPLACILMPNWLRKFGLNPENWPIFTAIALVFSLLGLPLALSRWHSLRHLFLCGEECQGRITSFWMERDRGRVEFAYEFAGATHSSGMALHKNPATSSLREGAPVTVLVDPNRPNRAILPDLFHG